MLFEGCQGKEGVKILEKVCPDCGNIVEMMSTDVCTECEQCGHFFYNDQMDCVWTCPNAVKCVGEHLYARLQEAKELEEIELREFEESDEW